MYIIDLTMAATGDDKRGRLRKVGGETLGEYTRTTIRLLSFWSRGNL